MFDEGYLSDARINYCPDGGRTFEDNWHPEADPTMWNQTVVGYAYWANYTTSQAGGPNPDLPDLIVKDANSDPDLVMLSDSVALDNVWGTWDNFGNHFEPGGPAGGNVALHDGSVRWRRFANMEQRLARAALRFYF